jgi:hypothetical protein
MDSNDDTWTPEEAEAMRRLASGVPPPADLEGRTVERLRRAGLLRASGPSPRLWWLAAAAGVALFAAGLLVGSQASRPASAPATPSFILLLYDPVPSPPALSPTEEGARVEEYRNWARSLRAEGLRIGGEHLTSESEWLGPTAGRAEGLVLGGYFVVSTRNYAAALAVARTCPHLKHGGTIEVRVIGRT